jgi:uncharacterized protein (TIGR02453 family)
MFPGFSPEALTFLRNLRRNNRRDWFQPRKEIFETKLKIPMIQLVEAINAELLDFAPEHIADSKKAVYRIYRDTRFSADKTPYQDPCCRDFPGSQPRKTLLRRILFSAHRKIGWDRRGVLHAWSGRAACVSDVAG